MWLSFDSWKKLDYIHLLLYIHVFPCLKEIKHGSISARCTTLFRHQSAIWTRTARESWLLLQLLMIFSIFSTELSGERVPNTSSTRKAISSRTMKETVNDNSEVILKKTYCRCCSPSYVCWLTKTIVSIDISTINRSYCTPINDDNIPTNQCHVASSWCS